MKSDHFRSTKILYVYHRKERYCEKTVFLVNARTIEASANFYLTMNHMKFDVTVSISFLRRRNKPAPAGCLRTTEMYSLTAVEATSPKSSCLQGSFLLFWGRFWGRVCCRPLSWHLVVARNTWCSLARRYATFTPVSVITWCFPRTSLCCYMTFLKGCALLDSGPSVI